MLFYSKLKKGFTIFLTFVRKKSNFDEKEAMLKILSLLKNNFTKYSLISLFFLMPFSSTINIVDLGFVNIFAYRLVLALVFVGLLFGGYFKANILKKHIPLIAFVGFMLVYAVLSNLWVENVSYSLKHTFYLIIAFVEVLVYIVLFAHVEKPIKIVSWAFLSSFVFFAIIGLVEIMTYTHIYSGFIDQLKEFSTIRPTFNSPFASFTNPNDFAVYLVFGFVLILFLYENAYKTISIFTALIILLLVYKTDSRLSMLALMIALFIYAVLKFFENKSLVKLYWKKAAFFTFVFVAVFMFLISTNTFVKSVKTDEKGSYEFVEVDKSIEGLRFVFEKEKINFKDSVSSEGVRKNLIYNGVQFTIDSKGFGVGAGQFQEYVYKGKNKYFCNNKGNPHNFTIEVLSQYGVLAIALLILLFSSFIWIMFKAYKRDKNITKEIEFFMLLSLIPVYAIVSNSPSSFISHSINWFMLFFMSYLAVEIKTKSELKNA